MHPTIIKIALLRCGKPHCENCPDTYKNCRNFEEAERIYDSHIKPLEDAIALVDAKALKATMKDTVDGMTSYADAISKFSNNINNSLQKLKQGLIKDLTPSEPIKAPEMTREKAVELLKLRESELAHYTQICDKLADRIYDVCEKCPAQAGLIHNLPYPYPTWCRALDEGTDKSKCRGSKTGENCWALYYSALITDRANS